MIFKLMLRGLAHGKARFCCAVAGVAVAVGTLTFMTSYVKTNRAQAEVLAARSCAPWAAWELDGVMFRGARRGAKPVEYRHPADLPRARADLTLRVIQTTVDYRPGGHVIQGPPLTAFVATAPKSCPYAGLRLAEGRWVDEKASGGEVVCLRSSMRRFGREPAPKLGDEVTFVGRKGTMKARVVGYLEGGPIPAQFPSVFANPAAFGQWKGEALGSISFYADAKAVCAYGDGEGLRAYGRSVPSVMTARSEAVVATFRSDEQRHLDYARPLLLIASILTALALLVNSLLLSVESNRAVLATLRVVGLTRGGVVRFMAAESLFESVVGAVVGIALSCGAVAAFVAADPAAFPVGVSYDVMRMALTLTLLPVVVGLSVLFALAPALRVRGMDATNRLPRPRRRGMAITFAVGFAAFVAVEVWGASLMRAFMPSPEWPDAIVSLLPGGVSSWDVEKLRDIPGVRRISELVPRQLMMDEKRNALFMAAEFLPKFAFMEGDWESSDRALREGDGVVITRMMSNACNLHVGSNLVVRAFARRGEKAGELVFPIVGVVDLNWHMVTSRGLVRGLFGAPKDSIGPVFCSLDTMGVVDPRTMMTMPGMSAPMTHLWVDYDPQYVKAHGVFETGRAVEAEIARRLGHPATATVRLHARDEISDGTLAHGTDVIGQAARVPFVFLAILSIGFVAMLVAEADARRREFRILRAVGATRLQLAGCLVRSALATAVLGLIVGFPLGTAVGWYATLGTGSLWAGLPHYLVIPTSLILQGAAGAIVFALLVSIPASLAILRKNR